MVCKIIVKMVNLMKIEIFIAIVTSIITFSHGYLYWIEPRSPLPGTPSPPGSPWPLPQQWESLNTVLGVGSKDNFHYNVNVDNCEPLQWATQKYNYDFLFGDSAVEDNTLPLLSEITISISDQSDLNHCGEFPRLAHGELDYESYNISIKVVNDEGVVSIYAKAVWGAIRGIETLSQLFWDKEFDDSGLVRRSFYANVTEIIDFPRFSHRGIMIDTARHYIPVPTINNILDAMFYNKFNVLHWHCVDDQSFPFVSIRFPDLSLKGAYNPKAIYTPEQVRNVINDARLRGIRVIFEFDSPGHTNSWGRAYPELLTPCYGDSETPGTPNYPEHAAYENLDPTRQSTYDFTRELFSEIVNDVSKDEYIHLGMDEVYWPCWNSSPAISSFMLENGYVNLSQVQGHYTTRNLNMVQSLGAKPIIWQDPMDAGVELPEDLVIQIWKDWEPGWINHTQYALDAGHKVVLSAPWYLNYIGYGQSWKNYYEVDPINDLPDVTEEQKELVLGGEVCMWAEYVDKTNIITRLFPFASAVAERLWSSYLNTNSTDDAAYRLDQHRCRMLWRGVQAQPILNGYCGSWEVDV